MDLVRLSQPQTSELEREYVERALTSVVWHGDGPFTAQASAWLRSYTGTPAALLTPSCTHALELAALLLDLAPGDEVICPSYTFPSTVTAVVLRGATPVLVDVDPITMNLDVACVRAALTEQTRAVFVVHYAGVAADLDALLALLDPLGIPLVEDNAHGLGASWRGQHLGTFGALGTQSFHDTKNISCGEGGALLVNRLDLLQRAEIIREKGTDRSRFLRGEIDKYTWTDTGSSYLLSELQAALLAAQMERFELIQKSRHEVWDAYNRDLTGWATEQGVQRMTLPDGCAHPAHLYWMCLPSNADQMGLIGHLRERGVVAAFHYQALDASSAGQRFARVPEPCVVSRSAAERLVRLPLHGGMDAEAIERVLDAVSSYRCSA